MNSWQEIGKQLEDKARDATRDEPSQDEPMLLSVHILLDDDGNPLDWLGPNLQISTHEQWLVLKAAAIEEGQEVTTDTTIKKHAVEALISYLKQSANNE